MSVDFDVRDNRGFTFSLEFKVKMPWWIRKHAAFTSQDVNWWTGVVWSTCGLLWCFINCLDSHSDGTHSLQRIHWWASDVMLHFSKSVLMKKLIYSLDVMSVSAFSTHFHFCVITNDRRNTLSTHSWQFLTIFFLHFGNLVTNSYESVQSICTFLCNMLTPHCHNV